MAEIYPGHVLYLQCPFVNKPVGQQGKYLLVISIDPFLLHFIINSEINQFVRRNPELLASQIKLTSKEHPFLRHDSYIDCQEVIDYFEADLMDIKKNIRDDSSIIRGSIVKSVRDEVIRKTKENRLIDTNHKRYIETGLLNSILFQEK